MGAHGDFCDGTFDNGCRIEDQQPTLAIPRTTVCAVSVRFGGRVTNGEKSFSLLNSLNVMG